ncbi:hypothetical protein EDD21DRAFT_362662 [Dissophora ornata]|nr:hypothetical protein EDD21DRAFT_362662 [Dissophora ornata]
MLNSAGWSSSITRFKPMLNRKLAHPKPKSVARGIPAGFAAQSLPQDQTATTVSSAIAGSSMPSLVPRVGQGVQPTPQAPEMTIDETSWLKERTAQVQRQESDALNHTRKQAKKTTIRGPVGSMALDDDYDVAGPNEYEEFKVLYDDERRLREDEIQTHMELGRRQNPYARSRSRSRSYAGAFPRSRSRSRSRTNSGTKFRSGSQRRSQSPRAGTSSRRSRSREQPCSPPAQAYGSTKVLDSHSSGHPKPHTLSGSRSKSPHSQENHHLRRRSGSPPPTFKRRTPSPAPGCEHPHTSSPSYGTPGHSTSYKAFAPPPNLTEESHAVQGIGGERSAASDSTPSHTVMIMNDTSGEDAFLRRARLSKQRSVASLPSHSQPRSVAPTHEHQGRTAFSPRVLQSPKGTPSNVILLTNMVGPGEVDNSLQEETAVECGKYGSVVRCLIFEVQNGKVPPEEAVRIFVKFETITSAEKALQDLDGRFFGGRQVCGRFFDERRFDLLQLAP